MAKRVELRASSITPTKPTPRPATRDRLLGSRSQSIAIKAPNIGLVALRIDDKPAGM